MPTSFIITLPADEDELRDEIEERLGAQGDVYEAPPTYAVDAEQVKLLVEIAVGGATLVKTLLEIKQLIAGQNKPTHVTVEKPGKGSVVLGEANEHMLKELFGASSHEL